MKKKKYQSDPEASTKKWDQPNPFFFIYQHNKNSDKICMESPTCNGGVPIFPSFQNLCL